MTADEVIRLLRLEPLDIEGGHFRETYRSVEVVPTSRVGGERSFGSAIFYLLRGEPDSFSSLHRLATDEVYHFYLGDPIEMLLLKPSGESERVVLGSDIAAGQQVQYVVPCGWWQGSRVIAGGKWALLGTTMAPAFDGRDFEAGKREDLQRQYPREAELIRQLTRG